MSDEITVKDDEIDHALTREILATLAGAGFALYGICRAQETSHRAHFTQWLAEVGCGEMTYLTQHIEQRMNPQEFVPTARSIICVADRYASGKPDPIHHNVSPRGRIARYARGRDYHLVIRERLEPIADDLRKRFPGHRFRVCVDTAPILEREHAQRAGLGRVGKHTLLIGEKALAVGLCLAKLSHRSTWRLVNRWLVTRVQHARVALTRVPRKPSSPGSCTPSAAFPISPLSIDPRPRSGLKIAQMTGFLAATRAWRLARIRNLASVPRG